MKPLYTPPLWLRAFTGKYLTWHFPAGERKIYLSFDDGPCPLVTTEIIRLLEQYQAKATFFLSGKNAKSYPELVQEILVNGHMTGNHGWDHMDGWVSRTASFIENVEKARLFIPGTLFRPPYGRLTPRQAFALKKKGMEVIMWSVLVPDYAQNINLATTLKKVISRTGDGSILVFHDSEKAAKNCLALLPAFLEHFSGLGYSFEAIQPRPKPS